MKRALIAVEERGFRRYVTGVVISLNDCYIRQTLNKGQINVLRVATEKCETYDEVKYGRLVVRRNEHNWNFEDYCYVCRTQAQM